MSQNQNWIPSPFFNPNFKPILFLLNCHPDRRDQGRLRPRGGELPEDVPGQDGPSSPLLHVPSTGLQNQQDKLQGTEYLYSLVLKLHEVRFTQSLGEAFAPLSTVRFAYKVRGFGLQKFTILTLYHKIPYICWHYKRDALLCKILSLFLSYS